MAPELTGFILFFTSLLALGSFGFVGRFIINVFRLFVGETYAFMTIILLATGLYLLLKGEWPSFKGPRTRGAALLYVAWLVFNHSRWVLPVITESTNSVTATWQAIWPQVTSNSIGGSVGGGMIGAVFFGASHFLFAMAGTYIMIVALVFVGIMAFFQLSYRNLFERIRKGLRSLINGLKNSVGSAVSHVSDSRKKRRKKPKTARKPKKSRQKKEEIKDQPDLTDNVEETTPVNESAASEHEQTTLKIEGYQEIQEKLQSKNTDSHPP
ncbi:MAG: hypothetical protein LRY37_03115 [Alkalibacterium thalassium]|nr:hypothetical protein [Alkalibacterium thalassium]